MNAQITLALKDGVPILTAPVSGTELFDCVKAVIKSDTRCYNSLEWLSGPGESLAFEQQPDCGWVGCVGGWALLLMRGGLTPSDVEALMPGSIHAGVVVIDVLGIFWGDAHDIFAAMGVEESRDIDGAFARIDRFVNLHRRHLDAIVVQPNSGERELRRHRVLDTRQL